MSEDEHGDVNQSCFIKTTITFYPNLKIIFQAVHTKLITPTSPTQKSFHTTSVEKRTDSQTQPLLRLEINSHDHAQILPGWIFPGSYQSDHMI